MRAYDYRSQARWALKGKWKLMIGIMLLAQIVLGGLGLGDIAQTYFSQQYVIDGSAAGLNDLAFSYSLPTGFGWVLFGLGQLVMFLFSGVTYIGLYRVTKTALDGGVPGWRQLFPINLFFKALCMNIVRGVLVILQLMLFIVPGVIAAFRYTMADYLLAENPELGPIEALRLSSKHMKGNKANLFVLYVSFAGWALLASLVPAGAVLLLVGMPMSVLLAVELIVNWLCSCALNVYTYTAETAFFEDIVHGSVKRDWHEARRETWAQEEYQPEPEAQPAHSAADETAARELFIGHQCSMDKLRRAGRMEEYESLNPSPISQEKWKRDYAQLLMRRFDRDPAALKDLLSLAAEYAMDDLADRTIQRINRHILQQTLPAEEILNMAGQALATLLSGAFAGSEGFVGRKQEQIADMANRLERCLQQENPDGEWRQALQLVRQMCER